jgi:hypothetical protein
LTLEVERFEEESLRIGKPIISQKGNSISRDS